MTASGDPEFGARLLEEAANGTSALEGNTALLFTYGIYLANGGKPSDFMDFTPDDVQIMFTSYLGAQKRAANSMVRALIKAMNRGAE